MWVLYFLLSGKGLKTQEQNNTKQNLKHIAL